ncbi:MAG: peptide chain release factor N(5)-glutamine methyltransferase [Eubacteriales bacterium]|nr:peptide chain release factor N(5)-glutamine methyltransferase [Eubacteriales bacterium]
MVIRELLNETAKKLNGIDNYMFETHLIVRTILKMSPMDLVLSHKKEVENSLVKAVRSAAERRINGEPLQYILGTQEFMGIEFKVAENVLIPRADTETLVETVLSYLGKKGACILDIGSGSGCVGLSIAYHNERVYLRGVDISDAALTLSKENAQGLGLTERAAFSKADILTENLSGKYDIIVSNPPYIRSDVIPTLMQEVQCFEPHLALDGGEDGLIFYRTIIAKAPKLLNEKGLLAFEIGFDQGEDVSALMREAFDDIKVIKDLAGNDRVVTGIVKC